jgi:hypothetical protein
MMTETSTDTNKISDRNWLDAIEKIEEVSLRFLKQFDNINF